jgi:3-hydroxybutyryl-CoA dehydrogenase
MHLIKTICVCGAGTMGTGIAQICVQSGYPTLLFDLNSEVLKKSIDIIYANWQGLVDKNKISEVECLAFKSRLTFNNNINNCRADLIIEAIIEKLSAKIDLFQQLEAINPINTLLVTNTSSISISLIAAKLDNPYRFAGMHFFNPATYMKLIELVKSDHTSDALIKLLQEVAVKMGKTAVISKDSAGFIVNRVARHFYLESLLMIEQGNTSIESIDAVLEATGFKMGPFKLMDLIGIDINYGVSCIIWEALGKPNRLKASAIQAKKIEQKELGKKTEKGFYYYGK